MNHFFEWVVRRRWPVILCTALAAALGVLAWVRLPIDAFPDVTNLQVMILTKAPGLSSRDIEQRVTYPIELQMGGLPKVKGHIGILSTHLFYDPSREAHIVLNFGDNTRMVESFKALIEIDNTLQRMK